MCFLCHQYRFRFINTKIKIERNDKVNASVITKFRTSNSVATWASTKIKKQSFIWL